MKRKKSKIISVPDWFNLKDYDVVRDFDHYDWALNMGLRENAAHLFLYDFLYDSPFVSPSEEKKKKIEIFDPYWDNNFLKERSELLIPENLARRKAQTTDAAKKAKKKNFRHQTKSLSSSRNPEGKNFRKDFLGRGIRPLSLQEACFHGDYAHTILRELFGKGIADGYKHSALKDPITLTATPHVNKFSSKQSIGLPHEMILLPGFNYAYVDLQRPLKDLTNDLEHYLRLMRNKTSDKIPKRNYLKEYRETAYNKKDFSNWHKYGLLPYIDLWLWQTKENKYIKEQELADRLKLSGVDSLRNDTKEFFNFLFQSRLILMTNISDLLLSQFYRHIFNQDKKAF